MPRSSPAGVTLAAFPREMQPLEEIMIQARSLLAAAQKAVVDGKNCRDMDFHMNTGILEEAKMIMRYNDNQIVELRKVVPLLQEAKQFSTVMFEECEMQRIEQATMMAEEREQGLAQLKAMLVIERAKGLDELAVVLAVERKKGLAEIAAALDRLHEDLAAVQQVVLPANPYKRPRMQTPNSR